MTTKHYSNGIEVAEVSREKEKMQMTGTASHPSATCEERKVYLDYNATTPLEPQVLQAVSSALQLAWGNPSSSYEAGTKAKQIIDESRDWVAQMVGGRKQDIILTSGGTEANNMVLNTAVEYFHEKFHKGVMEGPLVGNSDTNKTTLPHFITSNQEHDSVKLVLQHFEEKHIAEVTYVAASPCSGRAEPDDVMAAVRPNTIMITIMMANNETGVIQPITEIAERVKALKRGHGETRRIWLHTDAAQAIGKIDVNVEDLQVDYLTIVGHKFYGPRIGAVYVRSAEEHTPIYPMLYGGGQERNIRPGTENTGMIAGLGKAAQLVVQKRAMYEEHMKTVRDYLESKLEETFGSKVHFNGKYESSQRLPNTCNVSILGNNLKGHHVLSKVSLLQASVGAACHSQNRPSHILLSLGIPTDVAANALRLSVGRETTMDDIDAVIQDLKKTVETITNQQESSS